MGIGKDNDIGSIASTWGGHVLPTLDSGKYLTNDGSALSWGAVDLSAYLPLAGGTMTGDLDMGNQDIAMGTGLIGYDDTASKGLSFDSGNEKVTLESGQLILPVGATATPSLAVGAVNTGFFNAFDNLKITVLGTTICEFHSSFLRGTGNNKFNIDTAASTSTNPSYTFRGDEGTGIGRAAAGQPCIIGDEKEGLRVIPKADTDSDTDDVFLTGISGFHGKVLVRSITDNTSAFYRISNTTVHDDGLDGDHTSTKDTGSHYNFYYETDQFKLQNKVGDNKSVSVVFWVLPT